MTSPLILLGEVGFLGAKSEKVSEIARSLTVCGGFSSATDGGGVLTVSARAGGSADGV